MDDRAGALALAARDKHPSAPEPQSRSVGSVDRCGDQRLGWRIAPDTRLCEPRGAMAEPECIGRRNAG